MKLKLSLVISTLGRRSEFPRLLQSFAAQSIGGFEAIIVDQNDEDILSDVLRSGDWPFPIRHVCTPGERGLSRGRNRGWPEARGEIVLFPDDDCWYPPGLFERALSRMEETAADILAGRAADLHGRSINGRFEKQAQKVTRRNVWTTQIEWMVFFRKPALAALGGYDENIGIGASSPWQSCEGQDIVLRALEAGLVAWFDPALAGHHAELDTLNPNEAMRAKGRAYARGFGHVLRKHAYSLGDAAYWSARPAFNMLRGALKGNAAQTRYFASVAAGRLEGFFGLADR